MKSKFYFKYIFPPFLFIWFGFKAYGQCYAPGVWQTTDLPCGSTSGMVSIAAYAYNPYGTCSYRYYTPSGQFLFELPEGATYDFYATPSNRTIHVSAYYDNSGCESPKTAFTVPLNPNPNPPNVEYAAACNGSAYVKLTGAAGGQYVLYRLDGYQYVYVASNSTGIFSIHDYYLNNSLSTMSSSADSTSMMAEMFPNIPVSMAVVVPQEGVIALPTDSMQMMSANSSNYSYYASIHQGSCISSMTNITIPDMSIYVSPSSTQLCAAGPVTMTARFNAFDIDINQYRFKWYNASMQLVKDGDRDYTAQVTSETQFYVKAYHIATGCESELVSAYIKVGVPTVKLLPPKACSYGEITFTATEASTGVNYYTWYKNGTQVKSGSENFLKINLSENANISVKARNNYNCESALVTSQSNILYPSGVDVHQDIQCNTTDNVTLTAYAIRNPNREDFKHYYFSYSDNNSPFHISQDGTCTIPGNEQYIWVSVHDTEANCETQPIKYTLSPTAASSQPTIVETVNCTTNAYIKATGGGTYRLYQLVIGTAGNSYQYLQGNETGIFNAEMDPNSPQPAFYLTRQETGYCESEKVQAPLQDHVEPTVTASRDQIFGSDWITLTISGRPEGWQYILKNQQGFNLRSNMSDTINCYVDQDKVWFVSIKHPGSGCETSAARIEVISHKIDILPPDDQCSYVELTFKGQRSGYFYYWQDNPNGVSPYNENPFRVTQSGTYYVRARKDNGTWGGISNGIYVRVDEEAQCLNYIFKQVTTVEGITSEEQLDTLTGEQIQRSYTYYDGLGRPEQNVAIAASPSQKDIVTPFVYDRFGRDSVKYLPYEATTNNGYYKSDALAAQSIFYSNPPANVTRDASPYATMLFESSPLNRPVGQYGAGNDWYVADKKQTVAYRGNTANEVLQWMVTTSQISAVYYSVGTIYVTETTDEDGHSVIEYIDLQGRAVRRAQNTDDGYAITDHVYDDFGRLAYVIPPVIDKIPQTIAISDNNFAYYIYAYRYDERGQVIEKHIPGAGWTYIIYNYRQLPVMTQTAEQRTRNEWNFTKYDAFGRIVMTGVITDSRPLDEIHDVARQYAWAGTANAPCRDVFESFNPNETLGYSNCAFPHQVPESSIMAVYYYDHYNFDQDGASARQTIACDMTQGLPTGSKVRILNTNDWLTTVNYYDPKGRLQEILSKNIKGHWERVVNEYDFVGRLTVSTRNHDNLNIATSQEYDHAGRLISVEQSIGGQTFPVANNTYNTVGQLVETSLHDGLETVAYKYNIRGWLSEINSQNFKEKIRYEQSLEAGGQQWAGNISSIEWHAKTVNTDWHAYQFWYDELSRLTYAYYMRKGEDITSYENEPDPHGDYYSETMGYRPDNMGNLDWLARYAGVNETNEIVQIDDIVYFYDNNNNQVSRIRDYESSSLKTLGFKDVLNNDNTYYEYDAAGRLEKDNNLGVEFTYNHLNLLNLAKKETDSLKYTYDGAGRRVKKQLKTNTPRYYIDGIEYEGDQLKFISTPYGRIRKTTTGWTYDYFLKDHLGNVRVVFAAEPGNTSGSSTQTYMATMEDGKSGEENTYFDNLASTRADRPLNYPDKNPMNQKLSKVPGKSRGPSIMLQVMAGDTIEISAKAFYNIDKAMPGVTPDIAPVLGSAIAAMSNPTSAIVGEASQLAMDLGANPSTSMALITPPSEGQGEADPTPEAGINFVLYNNSFEVIDENTGVIKVEDQINTIQNLTTDKIVIQQAGFFEVFINNEAQTPVYFDNLMVAHTEANVLEVNAYYPFGMIIPQLSLQASAGKKNYYKYNAKELQEELELNWLDYGARVMTPAVGRWWVPDPMTEKYYGISPYTYALNNPINAIDPDGRVVIFINGNHFGDGAKGYRGYANNSYGLHLNNWNGTRDYWAYENGGGFDIDVMNHLGDFNAIYRDGSIGGYMGVLNIGALTARGRENHGYGQGMMDAERIIANLLRDENGNILETIKVITHSMGGAYGKGYVRALLEYAEQNGVTGLSIAFEADFAPYQPNKQRAVNANNMGPTLQFSHSKDKVAGNKPITDAVQQNTDDDENQGHSIFDFINQIQNLPAGNYGVIDGRIVPY